jgi:hypothetical protein
MSNLTDILNWLNGKKTYLAATIMALTGLAQLLGAVMDLGSGGVIAAWPEIQAALVTLGQALAAFGLRQAVKKASVAASGKAV